MTRVNFYTDAPTAPAALVVDRQRRRAEAAASVAAFCSLPPDSQLRRASRDRVVELHMPLVAYLARRYLGRNQPAEDLNQVGAIGLIKAIDRFDPTRGLAFSTYAVPTIVGEIKRHFRDTGWLLHVPRRAQDLQSAITKAREVLDQELGRAPTVPEMAAWLGAPEAAVIEAIDASRSYAAIPFDALADFPLFASDLSKMQSIDEGLDRVEQRAMLRPLLAGLTPLERDVIVLRFIGNRTQTEIALLVGVSQMHISRLVVRALEHMRADATSPARGAVVA